MSGGLACRCDERKKPVSERLWECWAYKHNRSAFNGYHYTSSDWSSVFCTVCHALWRTTAMWAGLVHQGVDSAPKRAEVQFKLLQASGEIDPLITEILNDKHRFMSMSCITRERKAMKSPSPEPTPHRLHIVAAQVLDFRKRERTLFTREIRGDKPLTFFCCLDGGYMVTHGSPTEVILYHGDDVASAIEAYDNA